MKDHIWYYYTVLFVCGISAVILLINLRNHNKKFSQSILRDSNNVYTQYMQRLSKDPVGCYCHSEEAKNLFNSLIDSQKVNDQIYPFTVIFKESTENSISYEGDENEKLIVKFDPTQDLPLLKMISLINSYGVLREDVQNGYLQKVIEQTFFMLQNEITFYRFVNIFVLTDISLDSSNKIVNVVKSKLGGLSWADKVFIKKLYYNTNAYDPHNFYDSLKRSNSPNTLEELQDDKILNIVVKHVSFTL